MVSRVPAAAVAGERWGGAHRFESFGPHEDSFRLSGLVV